MFEWLRPIAARSTLRFSTAREFTDASNMAAPDRSNIPDGGDAGTADLLLSSDPFEQKRFGLGYALTTPRTLVTVDVVASSENYADTLDLDNDALTTSAALSRTVSPRLRFGLGYNKIKRDFTDATLTRDTDSDDTFNAWVDRSLGTHFSLALVLSRYERSGTASYEEDRIQLRFAYSPTDSTASALRYAGR